VGATKSTLPAVETTYHATTGNATRVVGDISDLAPITITYQNGPSLANPSKGVQTLTITGPTPSGASTAEIMSITGFVIDTEDSPQYDTSTGSSAALQMKTFIFQPDGTTYTHTVAAT
tara:strand:- start:3040 stop:3393 length:354 start_codon:yes stop_codon:yes gene_type:complete